MLPINCKMPLIVGVTDLREAKCEKKKKEYPRINKMWL